MATILSARGVVGSLYIGTAVHLIGFGLPYWYSSGSNDYQGLWETCYSSYSSDNSTRNSTTPVTKVCYYNTYDVKNDDYLLSAQILASLGVGFGEIAFILSISWYAYPGSESLVKATTALSFIAGLISTGAVAVYGAGVVSPNDFAYWLTVSGCVFFILSGITTSIVLCGPMKSAVNPSDEEADKDHGKGS